MKAILVIDMPSSCATCEIRWSCKLWNRWEGYNDRLDGCPLKPMPEKEAIEDEGAFMKNCGWMQEVQIGMDIGWNACLEEIEK